MLSTSGSELGIEVSPSAHAPLLTRATASALARVSLKTLERAVIAGELEAAEYVGIIPGFGRVTYWSGGSVGGSRSGAIRLPESELSHPGTERDTISQIFQGGQ
jgi:hypothetical protein